MAWIVWWIAGATAAPDGIGAVVDLLSARHPVSCAEVEARTSTPVATLEQVITDVQRPPWAGMRAATCLMEGHAVEVADTLEGWVGSPEHQGLGRLVLAALDDLPVEVAIPVARAALAGPDADHARVRISAAIHPEIRTLSEP